MQILLARREDTYQQLMKGAVDSIECRWFAQMLASLNVGLGALPSSLGLTPVQFEQLVAQCFPQLDFIPRAQNETTLDFDRMNEKDDLDVFLNSYAKTQDEHTNWVIIILIAACFGNDHLWQDLGLWHRDDLSAMLAHYFPQLAESNVYDMKWKKFIYKQLCETGGHYVCRMPSCEYCPDYLSCFGDED